MTINLTEPELNVNLPEFGRVDHMHYFNVSDKSSNDHDSLNIASHLPRTRHPRPIRVEAPCVRSPQLWLLLVPVLASMYGACQRRLRRPVSPLQTVEIGKPVLLESYFQFAFEPEASVFR